LPVLQARAQHTDTVEIDGQRAHVTAPMIRLQLSPPKPKEFVSTVHTGWAALRNCTAIAQSGSTVSVCAVPGRKAWRTARVATTAPAMPAAPRVCPKAPLVDTTGVDTPSTSAIANASVLSLLRVAVPCACTRSTAS